MAAPAYNAYLGSGNPDSPTSGANYYTFRHGDAAFFVWDLRRYRSANEAVDDEEKSILGETQKHVFLDWLADANNTATFKFVVSSVPFQGCYSGPNGKYDSEFDALLRHFFLLS
jgi:alkaline phosphatase D